MRIALYALFLLILVGCVPQYRPLLQDEKIHENGHDALRILEDFSNAMPRELRLVQSIVFRKSFISMSAMGFTHIDQDLGSFAVVGLSPMGVKLFETKGDQSSIEHAYALENFTKRGDFIGTLAQDIKAIYFDLLPSRRSMFHVGTNEITFRQTKGARKFELVFDRKSGNLKEKRGFNGNHRVWRVFYSDPQDVDGKWIPGEILFKHERHRYQLSLILKEIK